MRKVMLIKLGKVALLGLRSPSGGWTWREGGFT